MVDYGESDRGCADVEAEYERHASYPHCILRLARYHRPCSKSRSGRFPFRSKSILRAGSVSQDHPPASQASAPRRRLEIFHASNTMEMLCSTCLRRRGGPPGTGMEPDCAFYLGERARAFRAAVARGVEAVDAFIERTAPDLVVEVEITNVDASRTERYAEMGVRELWRLRSPRKSWELRAEFLALRPGSAPRRLDASEVLEGLTPNDMREAVDGAREGETRDDRTKTVERVVRRRRDDMVRVREEAAAYSSGRVADPGQDHFFVANGCCRPVWSCRPRGWWRLSEAETGTSTTKCSPKWTAKHVHVALCRTKNEPCDPGAGRSLRRQREV